MNSKRKPEDHPWARKLPPKWNYQFLNVLISKIVDNRGRSVPTSEFGIPLIATNCISNDSLFPNFENIRYVSEDIYNNWFRSGHPHPDDIIFVNKGTPGLVCVVPNPVNFCFAQDMISLRANPDKIDAKYFLAVLRSPFMQQQFEGFVVGTLIAHVKKSDFVNIIVPMPTPEIQKKIGNIYFNLSKIIELYRSINQTMEKIIRSIFKSWFIDFDGIKDFTDSELGSIPKYWNVIPIGEVADFIKGFSYKGIEKFQDPKGFVFVTLNNIKEGGGFKKEYAWLESSRLQERHFVRELDLIIANTEQTKDARLLATPALVFFPYFYEQEKGVYSHHITKIVLKLPNIKYYLYSHFLYHQNEIANAYHTGTGVWGFDHIGFKEQYKIILPNPKLLDKFEKTVSAFYQTILENEKKISLISEIRDTFLVKSMSGKITL